VLDAQRVLLRQAQPRFVHQRGGLQRLSRLILS
jgi:hypothetical protein